MERHNPAEAHTDNSFSIQVLWADGLSVLRLSGSVGMEAGGAFAQALLGLADRLDDQVVLDLSGLEFINVIGLGVVVRLGNLLRGRGGRLMLHVGGGPIQRLVAAVRLDELFPGPHLARRAVGSHADRELTCC